MPRATVRPCASSVGFERGFDAPAIQMLLAGCWKRSETLRSKLLSTCRPGGSRAALPKPARLSPEFRDRRLDEQASVRPLAFAAPLRLRVYLGARTRRIKKFERGAVRRLGRLIEERSPSLLRAQIAPAAVSELRGGRAERLLREFAEG